MITRAHMQLTTAPAWQTFLLVFVPVAAVYLLTMPTADQQSNYDAVAAALPAWRFAQFGDLDLSRFAQLPFIIEVGEQIVSNRPPGIAFLATPVYWVFGSRDFDGAVPSLLPATATAAVMSAGAVGVIHLVLRRLTTPVVAVSTALVFAFGTSTWSISASELWPHGPTQLFLALAVLGMASNRFLGSGLSFAAALLIRPITGIIAAVSGLWSGWEVRRWRPVVLVGLGSAVGFGLLLFYNHSVLDTWSPAPARYGGQFLDRAGSQSVFGYGGDVFGFLFHPRYSVFVFSPFLVFTIPGLITAWKEAPGWVRSGAAAGVVYILVHLRLNRFWGGLLFNYRYALELLIMLAPLLFLSWQAWYEGAGPTARRLFWYSIPVSFAAQVIAVSAGFTNLFLV